MCVVILLISKKYVLKFFQYRSNNERKILLIISTVNTLSVCVLIIYNIVKEKNYARRAGKRPRLVLGNKPACRPIKEKQK